jgi:hypothetical protein
MIDVTIHSTGTGLCSLSGKEGPGLTVTFKDGTVTSAFLSWKAFQQLLGMKAGQKQSDAAKPAQPAAMPLNGPAVPVAEAKK